MKEFAIESDVKEYAGLKKISGFDCMINGETGRTYFKKKFRYSADGILWSDYANMDDYDFSGIQIVDGHIYVQFLFEKVGPGILDASNIAGITLRGVFSEKKESPIPECYWTKSQTSPQIVYNGGKNLFNPYAVGKSLDLYRQLSTLVSNTFGMCVIYFKTEANSRSRDVVLKEYSIEKVISKQNVKILVPDNQLPTKELQFNTMMIDYPVQFEVHMVKSEFQSVFGINSRPNPHDYLYFGTYLNKMYMVDSVSDPDDFGYSGTYWRLSLVPYQEMKSVQFDGDNLMEDTENLIFSAEGKFEGEMDDEIKDIRKDDQLNDVGILGQGQDRLRRILNPKMRIVDENIYSNWTVVGKQYYNMTTIDKDEVGVEYNYSGLSSDDERMISFAFRPVSGQDSKSKPMVIDSISENDGHLRLKLKSWDKLLVRGNIVEISRVYGANGRHRITGMDRTRLTIDTDALWSDRIRIQSCGKLTAYDTNCCVYAGNFEILQLQDRMCVFIGGKYYDYVFRDITFGKMWYFCVLGIMNGMTNMWMYEVSGSEILNNSGSEIKYVGYAVNEIDGFRTDGHFGLKGGNVHITNFRLWSRLCEQDMQTLILSQYVVDDTHNALIVDNAQNELLVDYKWN